MLDFDQTYFGCGNKCPAHTLKSLLDEDDYSFILPDNNIIKLNDSYIYNSIDTVFPFTENIDIYARATILHAANDLFASGVNPVQASISIGISSSLNQSEIRCLFIGVKSALEELGINSANYHTFMADQTSITVAMNGIDSFKKETPILLENYNLYLTKPLGLWSSRNLRQNDKSSASGLLKSNMCWLNFIRKNYVKFSTDISGFGLIGHLISILHNQKYRAFLSLNSIMVPVLDGVSSREHFLGCSSKSNLASFSKYVKPANELDELSLDVLYGGEINGPILAVVDQKFSGAADLHDLIHIGTISPSICAGNQIIEIID